MLAVGYLALIGGAVVASALAPPPSEKPANTRDNKEARNKSSDPNERLAEYTFWLTCLTGGIVGTGLLQIIVLMRSDGTTRMGVKNAAKQTAIARRQLKLMGLQSDILGKQTEIQRQEFLINNRPKIRFRTVNFIPTSGNSQFTAQFTNIGPTEARILATQLTVSLIQAVPIVELGSTGMVTEDTTLGLGNSRWIRLDVPEAGTPLDRASREMLIVASVVYADGRNRVLATSCARKNEPPSIVMGSSEGVEDMNWED